LSHPWQHQQKPQKPPHRPHKPVCRQRTCRHWFPLPSKRKAGALQKSRKCILKNASSHSTPAVQKRRLWRAGTPVVVGRLRKAGGQTDSTTADIGLIRSCQAGGLPALCWFTLLGPWPPVWGVFHSFPGDIGS